MGGGALALRKALGLGDTLGALPIANGGTGKGVKTDDTQVYNYVSGDAVSNLTGDEVVYVSNMAKLKDAFNVYGKQVVSLYCNWHQTYQWDYSNTYNLRSCTGFDTPTRKVSNESTLISDTNTLTISTVCKITGTYQVNLSIIFVPNDDTNSNYAAYKFDIGGSTVFNMGRTSIGKTEKTYTFSDVINISNGAQVVVRQANDPSSGYIGRGIVDLKIVRVS